MALLSSDDKPAGDMAEPTDPVDAAQTRIAAATAPDHASSHETVAAAAAHDKVDTVMSDDAVPAEQDSSAASSAMPAFKSHLEYALVRDFAYPVLTALHYGHQEEHLETEDSATDSWHGRPSEASAGWDEPQSKWKGNWTPIEQLPGRTYGEKDGPPWSEDEDLQSPVVTSARHKKKSEERRGSYTGTNGDGSETYYVGNTDDLANGPGGEYITYPAPRTQDALTVEENVRRRDSHFAAVLPSRTYDEHSDPQSYSSSSPGDHWDETDDSRFSRDYQFTIVSPEEEMHGKAVALFDFARENENELPLSEGQIVLVSYRHGEGWLVAQDPKSGESGLIPEEYVRLLRDIEGGWNGLMNGAGQYAVTTGDLDTSEARTPTQETASHSRKESKEYYTPVVSTFSTSRDDFKEPWGKDKIASPSTNTPTETSRRGSEELKRSDLKKADVEPTSGPS